LPASRVRGLMIGTGVEPGPMHGEMCPQPCKRQSPRQDRASGHTVPGKRIADGSRSPEVDATPSPADRFCRSLDSPTGGRSPRRKSIGADAGARTTRGPGPAEMPSSIVNRRHAADTLADPGGANDRQGTQRGASTRRRDQACEGNEPQERRRAANEGRPASPGQAARGRTGSGTPREEGAIWRMTRVDPAEMVRRRSGGPGRSRA
jgi:hypothetical protein